MKKRIVWMMGIILIVLGAGLVVAGNYFYEVAINRSNESIELYGGTEEAVEAVSVLEEEQKRLEELRDWTSKRNFETVQVETKDGLTLKAQYLENDNPNGKSVILAHGYKGNSEQMPEVTRFYYEEGYNILKPDARGHGKSEGDYIGYGWDDRVDYKEWINLLINEKEQASIFLHGFSMGAATVLMTSGEDLPKEVKGIIADSGYTSLEEELSHQLKYLYRLPSFPIMEVTSIVTKVRAGYTFREASSLEQVKKNRLPLFIIHGDQDELVPTEMAYRLYEATNTPKELWIVPGAGHTEGFTVEEEEYKKRVKDFIEEVMNL
ncbi:alpha/beta hydrolase [Rossellomorea sp. AcN35-11]|nr:alpha/beta hydrolase [Rossellomorea aquimaris]NMH69239.1 alpha/beta hydrolase [Bacillus sp. RO3]WJV29459.1 alpha/beta hydrolase [Rossellomorea sp. AcN35-11]